MEGETREQWKERMGVGRRSNLQSRRIPTKTTPVVGDEGKHRGQVVGSQTEHASGRVDATVSRPEVTLMPGIKAHRVEER